MNRVEVFTLPWPPTANNSKVPMWKQRKMVSSQDLRTYHTIAVLTIRGLRMIPLEPPYKVTLELHAPKRVGRHDIMNYEKAVTDSMVKAGLITDDCRIDRFEIERFPKFKDGRVIVTVTERWTR